MLYCLGIESLGLNISCSDTLSSVILCEACTISEQLNNDLGPYMYIPTSAFTCGSTPKWSMSDVTNSA